SEIDVPRRTHTQTGETEPLGTPWPIASPDGSRLLFRRDGVLTDGRTGATIARFGKIGGLPLLLRDGTVVLPTEMNKPAHVTSHRPNAAPIDVALPKMTYAYVRGEIAPGRLAVQAGERWESNNRAIVTKIFIINAA